MKTSYVKKVLLKTISSMVADRSSFVRHPGVDFSRQRKCSFKDLILFLLTMEDSSLNRELRRFFPKSDPAFTKSAFCQQRAKLNDKALPFLLSGINQYLGKKNSMVTIWSLSMAQTWISLPAMTARILLSRQIPMAQDIIRCI